jgi:hypothetical protein
MHTEFYSGNLKARDIGVNSRYFNINMELKQMEYEGLNTIK